MQFEEITEETNIQNETAIESTDVAEVSAHEPEEETEEEGEEEGEEEASDEASEEA